MKLLIILALTLNSGVALASQWFCKEGSSRRFDNTFEVCGIGVNENKELSQKESLKNAFKEFDLVCSQSDDCKGKYKQVTPLRTDCSIEQGKFTCYRAFYIVIDPTKPQSENNNRKLASELEEKELELIKIQSQYGLIFSEKVKLESITKEILKENEELKSKIEVKNALITEKTNLTVKLREAELRSQKIENRISKDIENENRLIRLVKNGMTLEEVDSILGTNYKDLPNIDKTVYFGTKIFYAINISSKYNSERIVTDICYDKRIGQIVRDDCSYSLLIDRETVRQLHSVKKRR
jgi:hypothetical protein